MFHDRSLLGRCFRAFVLPVLEYCSAVWCSAANTHLKLLDQAVSGARFLTGGVFECDISHSHRRSVAVVCIRCSPVTLLMVLYLDPTCQCWLHAVLWSHISICTYAPPRCRTLQYSRTFIPFSVSLWNDLANPVFDGVGQGGFKNRANASLSAQAALSLV